MAKNKIFKGKIIVESLEDKNLVDKMQILDTVKTSSWTIHTILISKSEIENLASYIKQGPWYAHFWHGNEVIVVFRDQIFKLQHNQPKTWREAVGYGISIGIPYKQMDFPIE